MIQRDLEEAGIPYETEEGLADFHAAGRHTHITGLLKSGVSLVEAKELARHSDVRMTMKYTHIGLADQAVAVNRLPALSYCLLRTATEMANPHPAKASAVGSGTAVAAVMMRKLS